MIRCLLTLVFILLTPSFGADKLCIYVENNLPTTNHVSQIDWDGQKYWIKMADPSKGNISCWGKKIGSWLVPDVVLTPTVECGNQVLATEAARLKECEKKQGNCSRLILKNPNWLLLSDAGQNLETIVRHTPKDQRQALILKGLDAIEKLHSKGMVQGRASLKDLTLTESGDINFIDLAENPENSMTFDEACARDFINYYMTSLSFIGEENEDSFTHEFLAHIPQPILVIMRRTIDNISWAGTLAQWIDAFSGKDIRKFARAYRVLHKAILS